MAKVLLQNPWYAPSGVYFPASRVTPIEIPDELVSSLPKTAQVYDAGKVVIPASIIPMMNVPIKGMRTATEADRAAPVPQTVAPEVTLPPDAEAALAAAIQVAEAAEAAKATKAPGTTPAKKK